MPLRRSLLALLPMLLSAFACSHRAALVDPLPQQAPGAFLAVPAQVVSIAPPAPAPEPPLATAAEAPSVSLIAARTLRYRELFTGALPYHARIETWTLTLSNDGRFMLARERGQATENSLIENKARPLGAIDSQSRLDIAGTFRTGERGAIDLYASGAEHPVVHCRPGRIQTLAPGATLRLVPIPGENANRASWTPSERRLVEVLRCERAWLADQASWTDEPQPELLPFADLPGVEYAHDNDDMVVQKGGVRRLSAAPSP
ncbi:MAG: hypothetical protein U0359_25500 [Byssovorax sp.]